MTLWSPVCLVLCTQFWRRVNQSGGVFCYNLGMDIQIIFLVGIGLFSLSSLYFLLAHKKAFNSAFLVSFITIISYLLMYEGSLATVGANDGTVYATRWLFYALSCTLLMYEIGRVLGKTQKETVFLLYLTAIVMTTGAAAAYFTDGFMYVFFAVSTAAYVLLLYPLLTALSPHRAAVAKYIVFGWTGFPIAFLLAPDGFGLITAAWAAVAYLTFDLFTKVVFYLDLNRYMRDTTAVK